MNIDKEVKAKISAELQIYMTKTNISGRKFSAYCGVGEEIISALINGRDYITAGEKKVLIKVRYYKLIAQAINYKIEKEYWSTKPTNQFIKIIDILEDAKEFGYSRIIIGETGSGKTYTSDIFVKENIQEVFKVTVGSVDTISDLLDKICDTLNINISGSKSKKIKAIIAKLTDMRLDGMEPVIIFDESEFMKQATLCNMKELIEFLKGIAAVILIGTNQLIRKIENLKNKDKDGIPQFYSRIQLAIKYIVAIDTTFQNFVADIEDPELVKFTQRFCSDYRSVHDLLMPVMRQSDLLKVPLNLEMVKQFHGIK